MDPAHCSLPATSVQVGRALCHSRAVLTRASLKMFPLPRWGGDHPPPLAPRSPLLVRGRVTRGLTRCMACVWFPPRALWARGSSSLPLTARDAPVRGGPREHLFPRPSAHFGRFHLTASESAALNTGCPFRQVAGRGVCRAVRVPSGRRRAQRLLMRAGAVGALSRAPEGRRHPLEMGAHTVCELSGITSIPASELLALDLPAVQLSSSWGPGPEA